MADLCIKSNKINEGIDIYKKEINNCNNGSEKSILYHQLGLKLKEIGDINNSIINFLEGFFHSIIQRSQPETACMVAGICPVNPYELGVARKVCAPLPPAECQLFPPKIPCRCSEMVM